MFNKKVIIVTGLVLLLVNLGQLLAQNKSFISFDVQPGKNHTVVIQWNVRPEIDSFDYTLQKSKDAKTWETIANPGFHLSHNYSHIDMHPAEGMNYYRVILLRNREQIGTSDTKWIQVSNAGRLYLWPNPANDILHVKCPFVKGSMNIIDAGGKFISKISITDFITDVPTSHLSRGVYFLHVSHDKDVFVEKFVKD